MKKLKVVSVWRDAVKWFYIRFLYHEHRLGRSRMGLRQLVWDWLCGYDMKLAWKTACLWWFRH